MSNTSNAIIITAPELRDLLADDAVAELWNVLAAEYYTGEIIPGSRWVPVDRVGRETIETHLDRATPIVVYCGGPACPNSGQAAQKLVTLGYTNVRQFEGGLEAWKAAGLPTVRADADAAVAV